MYGVIPLPFPQTVAFMGSPRPGHSRIETSRAPRCHVLGLTYQQHTGHFGMEHGRAMNKICVRHFKTSARQLIMSCMAMQPCSLEGTLIGELE